MDFKDDKELVEIYEKLKEYCKSHGIDIKSENRFKEIVLNEIAFSKISLNENDDYFEHIKNIVLSEMKNEYLLSNSNMAEYLKDIEYLNAISKDEEMSLFKDAKNNREARNKIAEANLKLVIYVAKKYLNHGLSMDDLIQEGNLGLIKAIEKYEPDLGYQFSTYAYWWIRQSITRAIQMNGKLIRLPVYLDEKLRTMKKEIFRFEDEFKREPTDEELGERLGISVDKVDYLKRMEQTPVSLNTLIGEETDTELENFVPSDDVSVEDEVIKKDLSFSIQELFESGILKEREIEVLKMRFGFYDNAPNTLEEIGKKYGLTRERVRQIEAKALLKIKRSRMLKELSIYSYGNNESDYAYVNDESEKELMMTPYRR